VSRIEHLEAGGNGVEGAANQSAARHGMRTLRETEEPQEGRRVAGDGGAQPADLFKP
jgi:hypothetical protein